MARELRAWRHLTRPAVLPCDRCGRREEVTLQPDGRQLCWYCAWRADEIAEAMLDTAARRRRWEALVRAAAREMRQEPPVCPECGEHDAKRQDGLCVACGDLKDELADWPRGLWPWLRAAIAVLLALVVISQVAIHYGWL